MSKRADDAKKLQSLEGTFGKDQISHIEEFAKSLMRVYYQTKGDVSDYAKHKPIRELLKGYKLYRHFDFPDKRLYMASKIREIFEKPPEGMNFDRQVDISSESLRVVDSFFLLIDNLFGRMPSLVSRHTNNLIHAYDLALDLHWRDIYLERGEEFIKRREQKLADLNKEKMDLENQLPSLEESGNKRLEEVKAEIARMEKEIFDKTTTMEKIKSWKEEEG